MTVRLILAPAAVCWLFLVANAWASEDCSGPILQWSKDCVAHMNDAPQPPPDKNQTIELPKGWKYLGSTKPSSSEGVLILHIETNGFLHQHGGTYPTLQACDEAGMELESRGKIRAHLCTYD
jgi:hypothetical protein